MALTMVTDQYVEGAGRELDPLLTLPLCPACTAPELPHYLGHLHCLGGHHRWSVPRELHPRARDVVGQLWRDADREARVLVRRGVLYLTRRGRYALTPYGHARRGEASS